MLDVRFDGLGCDAKTSCDVLVGSALGDQAEDVGLADAESGSEIAESVASTTSRSIKRWLLIFSFSLRKATEHWLETA